MRLQNTVFGHTLTNKCEDLKFQTFWSRNNYSSLGIETIMRLNGTGQFRHDRKDNFTNVAFCLSISDWSILVVLIASIYSQIVNMLKYTHFCNSFKNSHVLLQTKFTINNWIKLWSFLIHSNFFLLLFLGKFWPTIWVNQLRKWCR